MNMLPSPPKKCYSKIMTLLLVPCMLRWMRELLSKSRTLRAHEAWKKLEESFEGTQAMKGAKAYILKEKFASFKMKEDESVPEIFHRLQVLVNDLKALGEKGGRQGLLP